MLCLVCSGVSIEANAQTVVKTSCGKVVYMPSMTEDWFETFGDLADTIDDINYMMCGTHISGFDIIL